MCINSYSYFQLIRLENIIVDDCKRLISLKITLLPGAERTGSMVFREQGECYFSYSIYTVYMVYIHEVNLGHTLVYIPRQGSILEFLRRVLKSQIWKMYTKLFKIDLKWPFLTSLWCGNGHWQQTVLIIQK